METGQIWIEECGLGSWKQGSIIRGVCFWSPVPWGELAAKVAFCFGRVSANDIDVRLEMTIG